MAVLLIVMLPFIAFCLWLVFIGFYTVLDKFTGFIIDLQPKLFNQPKQRGRKCHGK